jgi:hypothetical protein
MSQHQYEELKAGIIRRMPTSTVTPQYVRKLTEGAVAYARQFGFEPHRNYKPASLIFDDVDPAECHDEFVFGKDGKPFYTRGPGENQLRANSIVEQLTRRCGPDGFHYMLSIDAADDAADDDLDEDAMDDESDDFTEDILASTVTETPTETGEPVETEKAKPKGFFSRIFRK